MAKTELEKPRRERIREIWQPLYDMTDRRKGEWQAQGMAYLIAACVDETVALIEQSELRARIEGYMQFFDDYTTGKIKTSDDIQDRLKQLSKEENDGII